MLSWKRKRLTQLNFTNLPKKMKKKKLNSFLIQFKKKATKL